MLSSIDARMTKAGLNIEDMKKRSELKDLHYYLIFDNIFGLSFCLLKEEDRKILDLLGELAKTKWEYVSLQDSQPDSKTFRLIVRTDLDKIEGNKAEIEIVAIGCPKTTDEGEEECVFLDIVSGEKYEDEETAMSYLD